MIRRVTNFFERLGWTRGLIFVLILTLIGWTYFQIWQLPGGPVFVGSVLLLGAGGASSMAPLMLRFYRPAAQVVRWSGYLLMLAWILTYQIPVRISPLAHWGMHVWLWWQIAANFWITSHDPVHILMDDLQQMIRAAQAEHDARRSDDEDRE